MRLLIIRLLCIADASPGSYCHRAVQRINVSKHESMQQRVSNPIIDILVSLVSKDVHVSNTLRHIINLFPSESWCFYYAACLFTKLPSIIKRQSVSWGHNIESTRNINIAQSRLLNLLYVVSRPKLDLIIQVVFEIDLISRYLMYIVLQVIKVKFIEIVLYIYI